MGRCIKLLAARIFTIDKLAPNAIRQVTKKCIFFDNLFQVKKNRPIIVASNIKAVDPSIAKIGPKSPPTYLEKNAQFVPNSYSIVTPVRTPRAKLIANNLPQNWVISL